jgi:UDP-N-acetylmuramoylalanine--D-glutamate ligase
MNLHGKKLLVLGLGESGLAMAEWGTRQGARVAVADSRTTPPNVDALARVAPRASLACGPFAADLLAGVDLVALSPGVPVAEPVVQQALAAGLPVVSEIELFAWGLRRLSPAARVIAITGSNGKTTTTALTAGLCQGDGRRAVAAGNISPSALDALMQAQDEGELPEIWVLELSSFQLETTHTLGACAATVLNVSEDHLDRYSGMDAYAEAKARVFQGDGVQVLNRDDLRVAAMARGGREVVSFGLDAPRRPEDYGLVDGHLVRGGETLIAAGDLQLAGSHNVANALAAIALCEAAGIAPRAVLPALAAFKGLPHRVEFVARVNGVDYFDDSKGTNVGATLAALQGMGRKVAIILGGDGKGQDFAPLAPVLAAHGRAVALHGRDAALIAAALQGAGVPMQLCPAMDEAVRYCAAQAQPGDAVLLSPACSSLDMYRNYAHRAEVFIAAVRALPGEHA